MFIHPLIQFIYLHSSSKFITLFTLLGKYLIGNDKIISGLTPFTNDKQLFAIRTIYYVLPYKFQMPKIFIYFRKLHGL